MPGCCAVGCSNKTEDGFSLYNIPRGIRNSARREVWLQNISREDFRATPSTRLCEVSWFIGFCWNATQRASNARLVRDLRYKYLCVCMYGLIQLKWLHFQEHFTPDQFEPLALERGVKKLRRDAVPTLFKPSRQRRRTKRPLLSGMSLRCLYYSCCIIWIIALLDIL